LTAWQSIGPNVVFESSNDPVASGKYNFTAANTPAVSGNPYLYFLNSAYTGATLTTGTTLLSNQSAGNATANMVALEFLPTGALNTGASPSNVYLLLTEGFYNGTSLTYTEKQSPMNDWAQIRVGYLTGIVSVVRP
jgi:hypothetical protein